MTIQVGINGFGRMGRLGVRAGWDNSAYTVVQVNETATDAKGSAHLLKFDSVHGTWPVECSADGRGIRIGDSVRVSSRQSAKSASRTAVSGTCP